MNYILFKRKILVIFIFIFGFLSLDCEAYSKSARKPKKISLKSRTYKKTRIKRKNDDDDNKKGFGLNLGAMIGIPVKTEKEEKNEDGDEAANDVNDSQLRLAEESGGESKEVGDDVGKEKQDQMLWGRLSYIFSRNISLFVQDGYSSRKGIFDPEGGGELVYGVKQGFDLYLGGLGALAVSKEAKDYNRTTTLTAYLGANIEVQKMSFFVEGMIKNGYYGEQPEDSEDENGEETASTDEEDEEIESPLHYGIGMSVGIGYELTESIEVEVGFSCGKYRLLDETLSFETEAQLPRVSYEIRKFTLFSELLFFKEAEKFSPPSDIAIRFGVEYEL